LRRIFFREPFKNPAVGDTLLHYIARSIRGDYEAKKVIVPYGDENSSKGTVTKHLLTSFGEELIGSFLGDSLLTRGGDHEASKALSWINMIANKRLSYSSEITISDPSTKTKRSINGNLLKSLSGGGDEITIRTNHKDEFTVVNKSISFIFVNDLPDIVPADASVRDRLVAIPYGYSFVDVPTAAYHKKRDHTISRRLKNDRYRDAMVCLILDTMKNWNGEPWTPPKECDELKNDLAPMKNVSELLAQEYEMTGDPEDNIPTDELLEFLRRERVEGSDRKLGDKLTKIGLESVTKRVDRKVIRVRIGIRRIQESP
jgi:phage/plasmid-associated DNA primase